MCPGLGQIDTPKEPTNAKNVAPIVPVPTPYRPPTATGAVMNRNTMSGNEYNARENAKSVQKSNADGMISEGDRINAMNKANAAAAQAGYDAKNKSTRVR